LKYTQQLLFFQFCLKHKLFFIAKLHDCFSANELLVYEALQLCEVGKAGQLIDSGNVTYGGKWVRKNILEISTFTFIFLEQRL